MTLEGLYEEKEREKVEEGVFILWTWGR